MTMPESFAELIEELEGGNRRGILAKELNRTYWQVTYWVKTNNIPSAYWNDIIALAATKHMPGVTWEYLRGLKRRTDSSRAIADANRITKTKEAMKNGKRT